MSPRSARLPRLPARVLRRSGGRGDRGSVSLELVVVFPVIILLMFLGIQIALYYHARNVALAAAQEGLRAARAENGTAVLGQQHAVAFLAQAQAGGVFTDVQVSPSRTTTEASVTVTGHVLSILVIQLPAVQQTAVGPVERFTTGP